MWNVGWFDLEESGGDEDGATDTVRGERRRRSRHIGARAVSQKNDMHKI